MTDVIVVGAGPAGLAAALTVVKHGASVRLFDRLEQPQNDSRAAVMHTRTIELFERLGVAQPFVDEGVHVFNVRAYDDQGQVLLHATTDDLPSAHNFILGIGQDHTERILTEELGRQGVAVERGLTLEGLEQTEGSVVATFADGNGTEEAVEAKYLIGADGAHSAVRHLLHLPMPGTSLETKWTTGDVQLDGPYPPDEFAGILGTHGIGVVGALTGGRFRVIAGLNDEEIIPSHPTLEQFQEMCAAVGIQGRVFDPHYIGSFGLNTRLVPQMQEGRAFLVGDSAHVHSPIGGQGMNTSVGDAVNLGWKLALAARGAATDNLVASFTLERRANAEAMLRLLGPATKATASTNPVLSRVRPKMAKVAGNLDLMAKALPTATELHVNYRNSPVVDEHHERAHHWLHELTQADPESRLEDPHDFRKGPLPGERAPEAFGIETPQGHTRLHETMANDPRHLLLVFLGEAPTDERTAMLTDIAAAVESESNGLIKSHLVAPPWIEGLEAPIVDTEGDAHRSYGAHHECLYLIRPDSYVAFRSQPADLDQLNEYLSDILVFA